MRSQKKSSSSKWILLRYQAVRNPNPRRMLCGTIAHPDPFAILQVVHRIWDEILAAHRSHKSPFKKTFVNQDGTWTMNWMFNNLIRKVRGSIVNHCQFLMQLSWFITKLVVIIMDISTVGSLLKTNNYNLGGPACSVFVVGFSCKFALHPVLMFFKGSSAKQIRS